MSANRLNWMLWFEEDRSVQPESSLMAAVANFQEKYGQAPNRLEAPLDWPENIPVNGLRVERQRFVQPRHLHLAFDPALTVEPQEPTLP